MLNLIILIIYIQSYKSHKYTFKVFRQKLLTLKHTLENDIFTITNLKTKIIFYPNSTKGALSASLGLGDIIVLGSSWFTKDWENTMTQCAMYQSVGHELGHISLGENIKLLLDNEIIKDIKTHKKNKWVVECYCDAFGVKFAQLCFKNITNRELLESIKNKFDFNAKTRKKDKHKHHHPSWTYRLQIIKTYATFDKTVIKKVAEDFCSFNSKNFS